MANGIGIASIDLASATATKAQSIAPLVWSVMIGINVIMGTLSPMLINLPDLARYCKRTSDLDWVQGAAVFVSNMVVNFLGLAATASIQGAWGQAYWKIWDLLQAILDHHWTAASRTAIFLVSLSLLMAACSVNFGANSIPFGADMTGLFPEYLTIRRGQVLCAVMGICAVPWEPIANASLLPLLPRFLQHLYGFPLRRKSPSVPPCPLSVIYPSQGISRWLRPADIVGVSV